jgi:hypothetical protein
MEEFMEEPQEDHMAALKHLLRYVAVTTTYGLLYARDGGSSVWWGIVTTI